MCIIVWKKHMSFNKYHSFKEKQSYQPQAGGSVVLSNGNTAGSIGTNAAKEMERRTGVSSQTWEYIIAKESNGNPNAYNPSGASER